MKQLLFFLTVIGIFTFGVAYCLDPPEPNPPCPNPCPNPCMMMQDIVIRSSFTGTIRFVDNNNEIDVPSYKQLNPEKYPELAKRFSITSTPTTLILIRGRVISRVER